MIRNRGLLQIPLMLSLLVLAIALPVLSRVIKQNQDTRNRATEEAVCTVLPPSVASEPLECSLNRGCARMVWLPVMVDSSGVQFCKADCTCGEIVDGDNALCTECKVLPVEPTETPPVEIPVIPSPPPCNPTICDPEYDCLLNRCGGSVIIKSCDKCFPKSDSTKKKDYCTGCEIMLSPTPTMTPIITPTSTPSATPTPIISVTPTEVPVVTPGECKMPVVEDYFSVKFDKMIPEVDIMFAFDTTGSMTSLIKKAKEKGLDLLNKLSEKLGDNVRFGVVDFRDYPVAPYGSFGDYPYKLNVDLTKNKTEVMNGINGLTIGNGGDIPESYLTVMHSIESLEWRDGAKKILIFLADSIEHNPEVDGSKSITVDREIEHFKKQGISLLYLNVGSDSGVTSHWKAITEKIGIGGGAFDVASITTSSTDFVDVIMKLVVEVVRNIDKLYLNANPDKYSPWLKYTAMVGVTIPVEGAEIKFPYSINPSGVDNGVYEFVVELMGDKTKYASKSQKIEIICNKTCPACKAIGDYSCDGEVNGLDYSWWKQEFVDKLQHEEKWEASHICSEVTSEDYSVWRDGYLD